VLGNKSPDSQNNNNNNNNNIVKADEDEKNSYSTVQNQSKNVLSSRLEALTAACGEKILNPDFLLQGGDKPFTTTTTEESLTDKTKLNGSNVLLDDFKIEIVEAKAKEEEEFEKNGTVEVTKPIVEDLPVVLKVVEAVEDLEDAEPKRPVITLFSHKMKALKDLLLAEKLNTNAISLQITAQSQVQVGGKKSRSHGSTGATAFDSVEGSSTRSSKRARRD
jgi:menin